jgi:hypothetical protein
MATGAAAPAANSPKSLRVSRALVRPGRKDGGTIIIFRLRRSTLLTVTVVRVYPQCEVVGSFRVRGRAGINRIPFRGRLHGRPLANGTYRLLIGARAEATIVIARRKLSAAKLRKARSASACVPVFGFDWAAPSFLYSDPPGGAVGEQGEQGSAAPLVGAAKGAVKQGKALTDRAKQALEDSGPTSTLFLIAVAMFTVTAAALGLLLAVNLNRLRRERLYR